MKTKLLTLLCIFSTLFLLNSKPVDAKPIGTIQVADRGIQEVSNSSILSAGIYLPEEDYNSLGIEFRGEPVPVEYVYDESGNFEAIRFFGESIDSYPEIGRHSSTNAYILTSTDTPLLMQKLEVDGPVEPLPKGFQAWNQKYLNYQDNPQLLKTKETHPNYYWGAYFGPRANRDDRFARVFFDLGNLDTDAASTCTIEIELFGRTDLPVSPDHLLEFNLNGEVLGSTTFDGTTSHKYKTSVPTSVLKQRNSLIADPLGTLPEARKVTPGKKDENGLAKIALDSGNLQSVSIKYPISLSPDDDSMEMTSWTAQEDTQKSNSVRFEFTDFEYIDLVAWDIGNDLLLKTGEDGKSVVGLLDENTHLWAANRADLRKPAIKLFDKPITPESLPDQSLIIVYHDEFKDAALKLANHKENRGLDSQLVSIDALYDHFNYGLKHSSAIRDFVRSLVNTNEKSERYVLLLGGASFDTKELRPEKHAPNFIPSMYTLSGSYQPTSSDNLLSAIGREDPNPCLPLGRLPARTADEAIAMVDKIISFENSTSQDWKRNILFASGEQGHFHQATNELAGELMDLQPELKITKIHPDPEVEKDYNVYYEDFTNSFNQGQAFLSYIGHGASLYWRFSMEKGTDRFGIRIMTPENIEELKNKGMPSIVYAGTCYTNKFDIEDDGSIGLRLMKQQEGGAVAVISAAYRMTLTDSLRFQEAFALQLFNGEHMTLGEAYLASFGRARLSHHARASVILLGDPSLDITSLYTSRDPEAGG